MISNTIENMLDWKFEILQTNMPKYDTRVAIERNMDPLLLANKIPWI